MPIVVLALVCTQGCRCQPRKMPSASSRKAPEPPARKTTEAPSEGSPLELHLSSRRDHTSVCGKGCSVRELSTTDVSLAMLQDLTAQAVDSGAVTHVENSGGVQMQTSRTWSYHWSGSWSPSPEGRRVSMKLLTSSCTETFGVLDPARASSSDEPRDCPPASPVLQLTCLPVPDSAAPDGATDPGPPDVVWICGEKRSTAHPGSPLPWRLEGE